MTKLMMAEATYQDWGLHYVLHARIMVARCGATGTDGVPAPSRYAAYRIKKVAGQTARLPLGYCDRKGYPLQQTALL